MYYNGLKVVTSRPGYFWLKEKEQTKNNNNKCFHADDVVHMDETSTTINNICEDVSPVSCTCIIPDVVRFCWASSERPEWETECCIDRLNYARYLPCYNVQMSQLRITHSDVHAEFMEGWLSCHDWVQQPLRKNPCRSNDRRNGEQ